MGGYPFGHIDTVGSYGELFQSDGFKELLKGSIARRAVCKESCEFFAECAGGCADCAIAEGDLATPPAFSCYFFKNIFPYIKNKVNHILESATPLDELNPALKKTIVRCMSVSDGKPDNEISTKFV